MPFRKHSDEFRRRFVAAGTANFDHHPPLPDVPAELERVLNAFTQLGYETQRGAPDLDNHQLEELFAAAVATAHEKDILVAYYTGHGASEDRFYLVTRNSAPAGASFSRTALAADDLARALTLGSKVRQTLMIFDVCYAGQGAAELIREIARLTEKQNRLPPIFIIAATRPREEAEQGALSAALAKALVNDSRRFGGSTQQYLAIDDIMGAIDEYLIEHHPTQQANWASLNVRGRCYLFPNPHYRPDLMPGLDLETQRAFEAHWIPKARGVELGKVGWYFTGREAALEALCGWLSQAESGGRPRIVTGAPGSGKSALLSHIITLADSRYRNEALRSADGRTSSSRLPPVGVIDVAVFARRKLISEIAYQIAQALGLHEHDPHLLAQAIVARQRKTVIVLDALDESDDRDAILAQLIAPLLGQPRVFIIIGTRADTPAGGQRFRALGAETVEIDLDDPRYAEFADVARYARHRLLATEEPDRQTPYRQAPEVAAMVANAIAERAQNIFLVAYTAVMALLAQTSIVDVSVDGWVNRLPTGLDEAFDQYLDRIGQGKPGGNEASMVRAVLRPLAFAEGDGLPWGELWPSAARALSTHATRHADIEAARLHAAPFIVEDLEDGRSVYRLYHERIAEWLRASEHPEAAQDAMFGALLQLVPTGNDETRDWHLAHPHIKRHLATYAAKAGRFDSIASDPAFLVVADPESVIRHLSSPPASLLKLAQAYRRVFALLRDASEDERRSYLALSLLKGGQEAEARRLGVGEQRSARRGWMPVWTQWRRPYVSQVLSVGEWRVSALQIGVWSAGEPVGIVGRESGLVEVFRLADGRRLASWQPWEESVTHVELVDTLQGPLLIGSWTSGHVASQNLQTMESWHGLVSDGDGSSTPVNAMASIFVGGQWACVTAHEDLSLIVRDLPSLQVRKIRRQSLRTAIYEMQGITTATGPCLLAVGDSYGNKGEMESPIPSAGSVLTLWTPDLTLLWQSERKEGCMTGTELARAWGQSFVVGSQNYWGPPEVWRLDGDTLDPVFRAEKPCDRAWLVDAGPSVWLYTATHAGLLREHLAWENGEVRTRPQSSPPHSPDLRGSRWTRMTRIHGEPHVLSADGGAVLMWNLAELAAMGPLSGSDFDALGGIVCMTVGPSATGLFCGTDTGKLICLDIDSGRLLGQLDFGLRNVIDSITSYSDKGVEYLVLAVGSTIQVVTAECSPRKSCTIEAGGNVYRVGAAAYRGEPLVFASVLSEEVWAVRAWHLSTGIELDTRPPWGSINWRYQLWGGQEDKQISGLSVLATGDRVRLAFASRYGRVMVATFGEMSGPRSLPYETWNLPQSINDQITALACDEEGRFLAAGTAYGHMALWRFNSGECLAAVGPTHLELEISTIAFLHRRGGTFVVSGGADGIVRLWTIRLEPIRHINVGAPVEALTVLGNQQLAIASREGIAVLALGDGFLDGVQAAVPESDDTNEADAFSS
ncbi:AAA family ATPase [Burkholderia ubonensis]|uniref:AAA family ATPase n=1 Tax=Burkholderia ubonensis TaxID=101571 RepID=UPI000A89FE0E|nr:AAA family ATPase [Burkholderia ubonensis]